MYGECTDLSGIQIYGGCTDVWGPYRNMEDLLGMQTYRGIQMYGGVQMNQEHIDVWGTYRRCTYVEVVYRLWESVQMCRACRDGGMYGVYKYTGGI